MNNRIIHFILKLLCNTGMTCEEDPVTMGYLWVHSKWIYFQTPKMRSGVIPPPPFKKNLEEAQNVMAAYGLLTGVHLSHVDFKKIKARPVLFKK